MLNTSIHASLSIKNGILSPPIAWRGKQGSQASQHCLTPYLHHMVPKDNLIFNDASQAPSIGPDFTTVHTVHIGYMNEILFQISQLSTYPLLGDEG